MDLRLEQIKEIFQKRFSCGKCPVCTEFNIIVHNEIDFGCDAIEIEGDAIFTIEENKIAVAFYSSCAPDTAALYTKELLANQITEFDIYENIFLVFHEIEQTVETLFGAEADRMYEIGVYERIAQENQTPKIRKANIH